jgi:hypothetical protein
MRWVRHVQLHGKVQKAWLVVTETARAENHGTHRRRSEIGSRVDGRQLFSTSSKTFPLQTRTFGVDGSYQQEASSMSEGRRRNTVAAEPRSSLCDMAGRRKLITLANASLICPPGLPDRDHRRYHQEWEDEWWRKECRDPTGNQMGFTCDGGGCAFVFVTAATDAALPWCSRAGQQMSRRSGDARSSTYDMCGASATPPCSAGRGSPAAAGSVTPRGSPVIPPTTTAATAAVTGERQTAGPLGTAA